MLPKVVDCDPPACEALSHALLRGGEGGSAVPRVMLLLGAEGFFLTCYKKNQPLGCAGGGGTDSPSLRKCYSD